MHMKDKVARYDGFANYDTKFVAQAIINTYEIYQPMLRIVGELASLAQTTLLEAQRSDLPQREQVAGALKVLICIDYRELFAFREITKANVDWLDLADYCIRTWKEIEDYKTNTGTKKNTENKGCKPR